MEVLESVKELELISRVRGSESCLHVQINLQVEKNKTEQKTTLMPESYLDQLNQYFWGLGRARAQVIFKNILAVHLGGSIS